MAAAASSSASGGASDLGKVYDRIRASIVGPVNAANVITIVMQAIRAVESVAGLSGPEKRDAVVRLVSRLLGEIPFPNEEARQATVQAAELLLPTLIDGLVAASKGQLGINLSKALKGCCSC